MQSTAWLSIAGPRDELPQTDASTWVVRVSGSAISTVTDFFSVIASSLDFPDYFGANWAAFDECLGDLLDLSEGGLGSAFGGRDGRRATTVLIIVEDAEDVLVQESTDSRRTLVDIVRTHAAGRRTSRTASFRVHLICNRTRDDARPALEQAGVRPEDMTG